MMRVYASERGWWLLTAFLAASLLLHGAIVYGSRGWSLTPETVALAKPAEVEVTLAPLPRAAPKSVTKMQTPSALPPKAPALPRFKTAAMRPLTPTRDNDIPVPFAPKPVVRVRGVAPRDAEIPVSRTETSTETVPFTQPLPAPSMRFKELSGGKFQDRNLTPMPLGVESGEYLDKVPPPVRPLRDVPPNTKPLGPQDIKSGSGAAPGPKPPQIVKAPDTEPLPTGNHGAASGSGNPKGATSGSSGNEGGSGAGLHRGLPFGDPGGVLQGGDPNGGGGKGGGPGGPGTGGAYGTQRGGGAGAPIHVVYVLDISKSMDTDDKIGKAREALHEALTELTPQDTFNIVFFFDEAYTVFPRTMVPADPANITLAEQKLNRQNPRGSTNYSGALTEAFSLPGVTHVVMMSDGLPTIGVGVDDQTMEIKGDVLLKWIRYQNASHVHILTMALGLGPKWDGIDLLRDIADANQGTFRYIDMKKR